MKIALVSDTFAPLRTSGAVQIRDLAHALASAGHDVVVMVPGWDIEAPWVLESLDGFQLLRLRAPRTKDVTYVRRLWAEWRMPYAMNRNWQRSPLREWRFDGVVFYSPSIFHTPLVKAIKRKQRARAYLILRDIFPDWALDMGLLAPGPAFRLLKAVARSQYRVADVIGVQSPGNLRLIDAGAMRSGARLEVLHNWLGVRPNSGCSINLAATPLAGRKICLYAGNIGVAQKLDVIIELAERLRSRSDIGFVLVGRGNDAARITQAIALRALDNILMFDEIDPDEISALYGQCQVGLVILDERHRTHNIPGKFVSYMHAGLPVLAVVNESNDLIDMIETAAVGVAMHDRTADVVADRLLALLEQVASESPLAQRCRDLAAAQFSADRAAAQITEGLQHGDGMN